MRIDFSKWMTQFENEWEDEPIEYLDTTETW